MGKYRNKIQAACGMSVGSNDYVIYKLRTFEPDSHVSSRDLHVFNNAVFVHTDNSLMTTAASLVGFFYNRRVLVYLPAYHI